MEIPKNLFVPGKDNIMKMNITALRKFADFALNTPFKPGDYFNIEGTDKKKLVIILE